MKTYELTYIISSEITSEEAQAKAREIESAVQSREGTILKQINPVARTLAFPIAKRASGFFGFLEFQIEPEKLAEIKEIVGKDGKIVRHMVIIKEISKPRKIRRPRVAEPEMITARTKKEMEIEPEQDKEPALKPAEKEKVELKDIEQKLEELLG